MVLDGLAVHQWRPRRTVVLDDADAALLGEGAGRVGTAATVVMLTVGTGVGSAVMVDGRLHSGRRSLVEMGHIPVAVGAMRDQDGSDDACSCGQEG